MHHSASTQILVLLILIMPTVIYVAEAEMFTVFELSNSDADAAKNGDACGNECGKVSACVLSIYDSNGCKTYGEGSLNKDPRLRVKDCPACPVCPETKEGDNAGMALMSSFTAIFISTVLAIMTFN